MTKRRLSKKQGIQQKINQKARIKRSEQSAYDNESNDNAHHNLGPEQTGVVIAHHGLHLIIESAQGGLHHCKIRQNLGQLVTGDKVIWQLASDDSGVVIALLERKNLLARPYNNLHNIKAIAANIDLLIIVIAAEPVLSINSVDAYLVIAQYLGIPALILINKSDLLSQRKNNDLSERLALYKSLGYDWMQISTLTRNIHTDPEFNKLTDYLKNKTSILVGQSGVGKSSLTRYLIPDAQVRIDELCQITNLGKHTTTSTRLYHIPTGGNIIDSPGIRSFGVWHLSKQDLVQGFIEFHPFLGHCQFRNCSHQNELGCAIIKARDEGFIHPLRLENFYELLNKHGKNL